MTIKLLVARHGDTFGTNDIVRRLGLTDVPLVDSGLEQGRKLGKYLKNNNLIPDVIFASNLQRTVQTAEQAQHIMQTNLPIKSLDIFNEINYGPDENQPEEKVVARVGAEALKNWDMHGIAPKGWLVDPKDIIQHWLDFADLIKKDYAGKTVLAVTSNGIARFAPYLTGDFEKFSQQYPIKISTGAVCIFENANNAEHWQCLDWNIKPTD